MLLLMLRRCAAAAERPMGADTDGAPDAALRPARVALYALALAA
jgi:hypothetical protein